MKKTIMFVDDEGWFAKGYVNELEKDFKVHFCENLINGQQMITNDPEIKLLVLDIMMPTPEGVPLSATGKGHSTGVWFLKQIIHMIVARPIAVIILTNKGKSVVTEEISKLNIEKIDLIKIRTKTEANAIKIRQLALEMVATWHP